MKQNLTRKDKLLMMLIVLFAAGEWSMLTFWHNRLSDFWNPFLLLLCGVLVGVLFIAFIKDKKRILPQTSGSSSSRWIGLGAGVLSCIFAGNYLAKRIAVLPKIDYYGSEGSDVIPQIGIMVDRFLNFNYPYRWISEWTNSFELFPTYLPLQWMPYSLATLTNIDFRWFAFGCISLVILFIISKLIRQLAYWKSILLAFMPFIFLAIFFKHDHADAAVHTVEGLIAAYYLLLGLSLMSEKPYWIAFTLSLCLLSRYSIVLIVPLILLMIYKQWGMKKLTRVLALMIACFCVFYLPFLLVDYKIFFKGFAYHQDGTLYAWQTQFWQEAGERPYVLNQGLGFGILFLDYMEGSLSEKVDMYKWTHLVASLATVAMLAFYFIRNRLKLHQGLFMLGAMKIYLVVFYQLLQIPFRYLFIVPMMISILIIMALFVYRWEHLELEQQ